MSDLNQITYGNRTYSIEDSQAREDISAMKNSLADAIKIDANPVTPLDLDGVWVDVALDKTKEDIFETAASGKNVLNLHYHGTTIVCHQAEYTNNIMYFYGLSVDNALLIFSVRITADTAQAAMVGSVVMSH